MANNAIIVPVDNSNAIVLAYKDDDINDKTSKFINNNYIQLLSYNPIVIRTTNK